MKKKLHPVILLLAFLLLTTSTAAAAGSVSYDSAGLVRFGQVIAKPGGSYTAPNGQSVPAVITYTDVTGKETNYVSIRQMSELFDASVSWDASAHSIVLGQAPGAGPEIEIGSEAPASPNWPEAPVLGKTAGAFTEIDPQKLDTDARVTYQLNGLEFRSPNGLTRQHIDCAPGNAVAISVKNTSDHDLYFTIYRRPAISTGEIIPFTSVCIKPGSTMLCAFSLAEDADILVRDLEWSLDGGTVTEAVVSVMEYIIK